MKTAIPADMTGIRRTPHRWQVYFRIRLPGEVTMRFISKRFPPDTPPSQMTQWRENTRVALRDGTLRLSPTSGTFEDDAARYLEAVRAMPSYRDRKKHIGEWVEIFGPRPRRSITPREIRAQRDRWLTEPRTVTTKRRGFFATTAICFSCDAKRAAAFPPSPRPYSTTWHRGGFGEVPPKS